MKTKLLFNLFLFCSVWQFAFAQDYHPFLNNSSWIVSGGGSCCAPPTVKMINDGTDAVIGDYTYRKFHDPFPDYDSNWNPIDTLYIREDAAARKVYKIVEGIDTLLYDFTMGMGDTITQYGFTWSVTAVEDISCNDGTRKKITLQTYSESYHHTFTQRWIEGVGSNAHPFYPERNIYSVLSSGGGFNYSTTCSFQNGAQIYGDPDYCASQMLGTPDETALRNNVVFSPNPFKTELTINSTFDLQGATLRLYTIQGQLVQEIKNLSGTKVTIDRQNLASGLYFAQLSDDSRLIKSGKLMVD